MFGTVTKESNISKNKLIIPQNTEPKIIKDRVKKKILKLSILLKKKGEYRAWSIKQIKDKTINPVRNPLL